MMKLMCRGRHNPQNNRANLPGRYLYQFIRSTILSVLLLFNISIKHYLPHIDVRDDIIRKKPTDLYMIMNILHKASIKFEILLYSRDG